ncbi:hypothetical protein B0H11DRAFT_1906547 [Mycena galericulata]|nr:hypothetical protein B0H11DRAFT_1906547 [Mycena galericulata]
MLIPFKTIEDLCARRVIHKELFGGCDRVNGMLGSGKQRIPPGSRAKISTPAHRMHRRDVVLSLLRPAERLSVPILTIGRGLTFDVVDLGLHPMCGMAEIDEDQGSDDSRGSSQVNSETSRESHVHLARRWDNECGKKYN